MAKSTKKVKKIYLDYASSVFPNAGSIHSLGVEAKKELESSRTQVAEVLSARPSEIIFTSGGTESNNLAIQGVVLAWHENNNKILPHIITTNIEHPSVLETCKMLEKRKLATISIVGVESDGIIDIQKLKKEFTKNTILVSVMYANNEIGTIQPIREIAKEIRYFKKKNNINNLYFHTDAVQAVNYLDLNVERLGVDLLSISGSKIESSSKVGLLYKRISVSLVNIYAGGDQEGGLRPGTEDVLGIFNFSQALKLADEIKEKETKRLITLRDYFIYSLIRANKRIVINGSLENRLPNNINITIPHIPSDLLVIELSARGIMVSAKSACKSGDGKASHVIQAINKNIKDTDGSLRFSFGRDTNKKDIDYTIKSLFQILTKLKKWY